MICFCTHAALPGKQLNLILKTVDINAKFIWKFCQSNHIYLMTNTFDPKI